MHVIIVWFLCQKNVPCLVSERSACFLTDKDDDRWFSHRKHAKKNIRQRGGMNVCVEAMRLIVSLPSCLLLLYVKWGRWAFLDCRPGVVRLLSLCKKKTIRLKQVFSKRIKFICVSYLIHFERSCWGELDNKSPTRLCLVQRPIRQKIKEQRQV